MSPDRKERVLTTLNDHKHFTLMCGDGANDVGALKQVFMDLFVCIYAFLYVDFCMRRLFLCVPRCVHNV